MSFQLTMRVFFLLLAILFFLFAAFGVAAKIDWTNAGYAAVAAAFLVG